MKDFLIVKMYIWVEYKGIIFLLSFMNAIFVIFSILYQLLYFYLIIYNNNSFIVIRKTNSIFYL